MKPIKRCYFSLVELGAVIGIVAILSGMLIPVVIQNVQAAKAEDCKNSIAVVVAAVDLWAKNRDDYSGLSIAELSGNSGTTTVYLEASAIDLRWSGCTLTVAPTSSNNGYVITVTPIPTDVYADHLQADIETKYNEDWDGDDGTLTITYGS